MPLLKAGVASWVVEKFLDQALAIAFPKTTADEDYDRGLDYQHVLHGYQRNPRKAMELFRSAADKESSDAQCILGDYYRDKGESEEALRWYRRAANHNHSHALYELAPIYSEGKWVQSNPSTACNLVKRAAAQGGSEAQYGSLLWLGYGVAKQDPDAAADYFELAAKQ
jgi:TPR repeat protein